MRGPDRRRRQVGHRGPGRRADQRGRQDGPGRTGRHGHRPRRLTTRARRRKRSGRCPRLAVARFAGLVSQLDHISLLTCAQNGRAWRQNARAAGNVPRKHLASGRGTRISVRNVIVGVFPRSAAGGAVAKFAPAPPRPAGYAASRVSQRQAASATCQLRRADSRAATAPGSAASVRTRTTTMRRAPAART
jgi:hypothetical protein